MSRPIEDTAGGMRGIVIVGGAVLLGLGIVTTFDGRGTAVGVDAKGTPAGVDQPKTTETTKAKGTPAASTTTTTIPLKAAKDIKVLVANATEVTGAATKVADAIKPACYQVPKPILASAAVIKEKRPTTVVYTTPDYERESALLATQLGLKTDAVAPVPDPVPIPTKGAPGYNILVVLGRDFADAPPPAIVTGIPCTTTTTVAGSGSTATTRRAATTTTKAKVTTTTAKATTTTT